MLDLWSQRRERVRLWEREQMNLGYRTRMHHVIVGSRQPGVGKVHHLVDMTSTWVIGSIRMVDLNMNASPMFGVNQRGANTYRSMVCRRSVTKQSTGS